MRTVDEVIEHMAEKYSRDEIVDILDIPERLLLERFDDFIAEQLDHLNEELFDDE